MRLLATCAGLIVSPEAKRQKRYRERRTQSAARMRAALSEIVALTADKTGPAAVAIRKIAEDALS